MKDLRENIEVLINKANEQCQSIRKFIEENSGMFDDMNLKLHDANWYEYDGMETDFPLCYSNRGYTYYSYFNQFCENEWIAFDDWCKDEGINFNKMKHNIGRSSSFYLYEKELVQRDRNGINWSYTIGNIFDELGYQNYYQLVEFDNNGNIDKEKTFDYESDYYTREEWIEELRPALQYIIDEMYDDFMAEIEDVKNVYNYIKYVKENQVELFKEYLSFKEDDLQEEKKRREKKIAARNEVVEKFPEKIRKIMERSGLDKDDLEKILDYVVC